MKKITIVASIILSSSLSYAFDLGSLTKSVLENVNNSSNKTTTSNSTLDNSTVSSGLKEALKIGVNYAVSTLGANNGYLNTPQAKIPLPNNLSSAETLIRKAGGDKIANDLINSMNNSATKAAPKTVEIFINAIEKMSLEDANNILKQGDGAATQYFKSNSSQALRDVIKPIIQESMKENQVAYYYDLANNFYKNNLKSYVDNSSVLNMAKGFGVDSFIPKSSDESIDDYVTNQAIEGLFKLISIKENEIRSSKIAQTTSLLQKVFGN